MKKFIKRLFFICTPLGLLFVMVYLFLIQRMSRGDLYKIPAEVNSVILGHSHSACAFNDTLIEGFYNLSQSTEGYPYTYFKAKKILENNPQVKRLFVEFTNNQISPWAYDRIYGGYVHVNMPRMLPVLDKKYAVKTLLKSKSIERVSASILNSYRDYLSFVAEGKKNYVEEFWHNYTIPDHIFTGDTSLNHFDFNTEFIDIYTIEQENLNYLFKIKTLCREKGVQLYFVRSPLPHYVNNESESILQHIKNNFFADVPFLDFGKYPLELKYFADQQHVNAKGSVIFSRFFNDSVVKANRFDAHSVSQLMPEKPGTKAD